MFTKLLPDGMAIDNGGGRWSPTEDALISENPPGQRLARQAAQRAFWFGWYAQFPSTILLK